MKMVLVIYEAGIDEDLQGTLDAAGVSAYTKLTDATGSGRAGRRLGTQVWPGTNNLLWMAVPDEAVGDLVSRLRALRASYLKPPALRIFVLPVEVAE